MPTSSFDVEGANLAESSRGTGSLNSLRSAGLVIPDQLAGRAAGSLIAMSASPLPILKH